jgi:hypothetical protein
MTSELRLQLLRHRHMTAHRVARVFKATQMYDSKKTERLQVITGRTGLTGKLQPRRRPVIVLWQLVIRVLNATSMSASKFKETGHWQPLAQVSMICKLPPPQTPQIPTTQARGNMILLPHRVAQVFKATPMYASKETGRLQVTRTSLTRKVQ